MIMELEWSRRKCLWRWSGGGVEVEVEFGILGTLI